MKKIIIIFVLLVLGGGAFGYVSLNDKKQSNQAQEKDKASVLSKRTPPKACEIFRLEDAKEILGENVQAAEAPAPAAYSEDIDVTQCLYQQPAGNNASSLSKQKQASLLVRGAKTKKGAEGNREVVKGSYRPAQAKPVDAYGDGAFWNPQFGQLNILKNGNWYILSVGTDTPSQRSLEETKKLADIIIDRL